jgi:predicted metal-dependent phosphoesterase TrpH
MTPGGTGRADLHIHSPRLGRRVERGRDPGRRPRPRGLDVIAIADHERIDAAVAAQAIWLARVICACR